MYKAYFTWKILDSRMVLGAELGSNHNLNLSIEFNFASLPHIRGTKKRLTIHTVPSLSSNSYLLPRDPKHGCRPGHHRRGM
jgi:hypothetical protein